MELQIENLSRRFGRRLVFERITECVKAGECLAVTGPNGSGKTTLLAILAGLLAPSSGRVDLRHGGGALSQEARQAATGLVAPDLALYGELTALENLRFFARLRGLHANDADLSRLLEPVGLSGRSRDPVREFSSGMRVRLKYAFALLHAPTLLLLDEPTANLDVAGTAMVDEIVQEQLRDGIVVLATNDPAEARFSHRAIALTGPRE